MASISLLICGVVFYIQNRWFSRRNSEPSTVSMCHFHRGKMKHFIDWIWKGNLFFDPPPCFFDPPTLFFWPPTCFFNPPPCFFDPSSFLGLVGRHTSSLWCILWCERHYRNLQALLPQAKPQHVEHVMCRKHVTRRALPQSPMPCLSPSGQGGREHLSHISTTRVWSRHSC